MGMTLLIDFEKAFDSLEWDYLESVLKVYNFGEDFRTWFSILYKNSNSCVINNGFFTEFFKIGRSCRQGDPLSPYLFILAVEPLATAIRNSDKVKGILVNDKEIKIGQYADDTFLLLDGTVQSVNESFSILKSFKKYSGLKINMEKTLAVWLGSEKERLKISQTYQLNWVNQFELLGITFHVTQEKIFQLNFDKRISEIERIINMYSKFSLSLIGRVTVIKTLMLPKIVYLLTVLPTPPGNIFEAIEKRLKDFLWKNGNVRICNKQLEKEIGEGGLKLANIRDFNKSPKLSWLKRLLTTEGSWQAIFENYCGIPKKMVLELDGKSFMELVEKIPNPFWKDVLQIWNGFKNASVKQMTSEPTHCGELFI